MLRLGEIRRLPQIEVLHWHNLPELLPCFYEMPNIFLLNLSNSSVGDLLQNGNFSNLKDLRVRNCNIDNILFLSLSQYNSLISLDLRVNKIKDIPSFILNKPNLQELKISQNPIQNIPKEFCESLDAIKFYIQTNDLQINGISNNIYTMKNTKPEIFISYAWGGESEKIVDEIYNTFKEKDYNIIRDKINLGYKGRISEFMNLIGEGKYVIIVISDKYLTSENCMYEIIQVVKQGQFHNRIFPIILSDANFYKPINRIKYIKHWEKQIEDLNEGMKSIKDMSVIGEIQKELSNYREILNNISDILFVLKDMNTLTPDIHQDTNFEELFKSIKLQILKEIAKKLSKQFKKDKEGLK
jgi:hypothetical protein